MGTFHSVTLSCCCSDQCRANEAGGAPGGTLPGPQYLREPVKGEKSWQGSLLEAGSTVYRGQNNWDGSTPSLSGSTCAITLSTHKGEGDPRGAVMGQGPCQSLSPSVINPHGLNSWEGQVFGLGSRGAGAVLLAPKDPSDLCSCPWWNLTSPSALVLHLFIHCFVTVGPIFTFFSSSPFFR